MDKRRGQMRLDLSDFGELQKFREKDSEKKREKTKEDVERFYQAEIERLKKEFHLKEENIKKEYFQKGYIEGSKNKEEELKNRFEKVKNELISKHKNDIENLKNIYQNIEKNLVVKNREYLEKVGSIFLEGLADIFKFLYIQESNTDKIKKSISQILDEFKEETPLIVKVSKELYEDMKGEFDNIKIDNSLKNKDFTIEFSKFKIESKIEEKIKILKDEIKREIKKLT